MKWLESVTPITGAVMVWVSTRWGTKELGPPDQLQRVRGSKVTQQRGRKGEERAEGSITGAVLRHRMLPFLISKRFWRGQQKGTQLRRAL